MKQQHNRRMSAREACDLVDDDTPDGAYFMAAEIAGMDHDDLMAELADEALGTYPQSNKKRREKTIQCGGCKKWFAGKFAQWQHAKAKGHKAAP